MHQLTVDTQKHHHAPVGWLTQFKQSKAMLLLVKGLTEDLTVHFFSSLWLLIWYQRRCAPTRNVFSKQQACHAGSVLDFNPSNASISFALCVMWPMLRCFASSVVASVGTKEPYLSLQDLPLRPGMAFAIKLQFLAPNLATWRLSASSSCNNSSSWSASPNFRSTLWARALPLHHTCLRCPTAFRCFLGLVSTHHAGLAYADPQLTPPV